MVIGLTSSIYEPSKLRADVAPTVVQQKLSQIAGVGQVQVGICALPLDRSRGQSE